MQILELLNCRIDIEELRERLQHIFDVILKIIIQKTIKILESVSSCALMKMRSYLSIDFICLCLFIASVFRIVTVIVI